MRLFTGLALEYPVRRNLELLLEHLRPLAALAWSPPGNFHVTTKFIGTWPEERLEELKQALGSFERRGPLALQIEGLGWFDNPHHPRSLFAGVRAEAGLRELKEDTDAALEALGLVREKRAYVPHLTLARVKGSVELAALRQAIAQLPSTEFGRSVSAKHLLYKSETRETGSVYSVIGEFPI